MTKHLHTLAASVQDQLLRGPWPVTQSQRGLIDTWASLVRWHQSGEHVYRIRPGERSPAIDPDLLLATAPVVRDGQCYQLEREQWIVVARHAKAAPVVVSPDRAMAYPADVLTYAAPVSGGTLASGYINLADMPTPRHLKLIPGISVAELWARRLESEEIAEEALMLVRVMPFFYSLTAAR